MFNVFTVTPVSVNGDLIVLDIDLMGVKYRGGVRVSPQRLEYSDYIIAAIESQRHNPHLRKQLIREVNKTAKENWKRWRRR